MEALYPWLTHDYQQLTQAFAQGHRHHALLLNSPNGLGAETLIHYFAAYLFCQHPQITAENQGKCCGHCHSCQLFFGQGHPDYHVLAPIDNKDIGIDDIRNLINKLQQHAQQDGNKVVFIQQAEKMTEAVANALLKTLEEPPHHTYFILWSQEQARVMPTIYSRCQLHTLTPPSLQVAEQWLQHQTQKEITEIHNALLLSYGRPLQALAMLKQNIIPKHAFLIKQFWQFYKRRDIYRLLPYFEETLQTQQIDWLNLFLQDCIRVKLGMTHPLIYQNFYPAVNQFAQAHSQEQLLTAQQILQQLQIDLQLTGVNQPLMLANGLSQLITEVFEVQHVYSGFTLSS